MTQDEYGKKLRQTIMAIAVKKYGWSYDEFHELLSEWGYPNSLRKMSIAQLKQLKGEIAGNPKYRYNDKWKLDSQGKYMWHIMKSIGWSRKRLTMLMLKRYKKMHWNLLEDKEKRQIINILKNYLKKGETNGK